MIFSLIALIVLVILLRKVIVFVVRHNRIQKTSGTNTNINANTNSVTEKPIDNKVPDKKMYEGKNPFGVMLGGRGGLAISKRIEIAKNLDVVYYRGADVDAKNWNGTCDECEQAVNAGFRLILTVRNGGGAGVPSTFPSDLNAYKDTISQVLDKYKGGIELLVVENEENSAGLFYDGTPSEYHKELKAVCEVAHSNGVKCANGGLVSSLVALLVSNHYKETGQTEKGNEYLARTLPEDKLNEANTPQGQRVIANQVSKGKELVAGYKAAGADFVNFHWYIADTKALEEARDYLESQTGLIAISNEMGQQKNVNASQVTNDMQKVLDLKIPYSVWFSMDINGFAGARALNDADGSLRPNGEAFKKFIADHF